jgi:hypothetical protein
VRKLPPLQPPQLVLLLLVLLPCLLLLFLEQTLLGLVVQQAQAQL